MCVVILQNSYVYVFDGLPRFLPNGVVRSDHNLIGAFCGTTRTQPITVEATSGKCFSSLLMSDFLVGTWCTFRVHNVASCLWTLGVISVYFEANVSSNKPQGFNASFWVRRCHHSSDEDEEGTAVCAGGAQCQGGLCQCPQGYGGPYCDRPMCPQDCGATEERGVCNIVGFLMEKCCFFFT